MLRYYCRRSFNVATEGGADQVRRSVAAVKCEMVRPCLGPEHESDLTSDTVGVRDSWSDLRCRPKISFPSSHLAIIVLIHLRAFTKKGPTHFDPTVLRR